MKCLIIAAGQGTRLKSKGEIKPLVPLLGVPLIERIIRSAIEKAGRMSLLWSQAMKKSKAANFYNSKKLSKAKRYSLTGK